MHDVSFRQFLERTVVPVHDDNLVGALLSVVVDDSASLLLLRGREDITVLLHVLLLAELPKVSVLLWALDGVAALLNAEDQRRAFLAARGIDALFRLVQYSPAAVRRSLQRVAADLEAQEEVHGRELLANEEARRDNAQTQASNAKALSANAAQICELAKERTRLGTAMEAQEAEVAALTARAQLLLKGRGQKTPGLADLDPTVPGMDEAASKTLEELESVVGDDCDEIVDYLKAREKSYRNAGQPRMQANVGALAQRFATRRDAVRALRLDFDALDADRSGGLNSLELRALVTQQLSGDQLTPDQLTDAFMQLDVDSSGEIEFDEFKAWWDTYATRSERAKFFLQVGGSRGSPGWTSDDDSTWAGHGLLPRAQLRVRRLTGAQLRASALEVQARTQTEELTVGRDELAAAGVRLLEEQKRLGRAGRVLSEQQERVQEQLQEMEEAVAAAADEGHDNGADGEAVSADSVVAATVQILWAASDYFDDEIFTDILYHLAVSTSLRMRLETSRVLPFVRILRVVEPGPATDNSEEDSAVAYSLLRWALAQLLLLAHNRDQRGIVQLEDPSYARLRELTASHAFTHPRLAANALAALVVLLFHDTAADSIDTCACLVQQVPLPFAAPHRPLLERAVVAILAQHVGDPTLHLRGAKLWAAAGCLLRRGAAVARTPRRPPRPPPLRWAATLPPTGTLLYLVTVWSLSSFGLVWFVVPLFLVSPDRSLGLQEEGLLWSYLLTMLASWVVFATWALNQRSYRSLCEPYEGQAPAGGPSISFRPLRSFLSTAIRDDAAGTGTSHAAATGAAVAARRYQRRRVPNWHHRLVCLELVAECVQLQAYSLPHLRDLRVARLWLGAGAALQLTWLASLVLGVVGWCVCTDHLTLSARLACWSFVGRCAGLQRYLPLSIRTIAAIDEAAVAQTVLQLSAPASTKAGAEPAAAAPAPAPAPAEQGQPRRPKRVRWVHVRWRELPPERACTWELESSLPLPLGELPGGPEAPELMWAHTTNRSLQEFNGVPMAQLYASERPTVAAVLGWTWRPAAAAAASSGPLDHRHHNSAATTLLQLQDKQQQQQQQQRSGAGVADTAQTLAAADVRQSRYAEYEDGWREAPGGCCWRRRLALGSLGARWRHAISRQRDEWALLLGGTLFMPILSQLYTPLHCRYVETSPRVWNVTLVADDDVVCWTFGHFWWAFISLLALGVFAPSVVIYLPILLNRPSAPATLAQSVQYHLRHISTATGILN